MAVAIGVLTGALGGALLTQLVTVLRGWAERRSQRRSAARLLHEDFLHQQSTVARAYYRNPDGDWWEEEEFLDPAVDSKTYAAILGALGEHEFVAVASAWGWMQYFREARKVNKPAPKRNQLLDVYRKLATARYALTRPGRFSYRPHDHEKMADGQAPDEALTVDENAAKLGLRHATNEQAVGPVPGIAPDAIQETLQP